MAFDNLPKIDNNAANERLSKQKLVSKFAERYGFRAREQTPDNGADYHIELIEQNQASNREFSLQLKSDTDLKTLADGKHISYSFETSRLAYLLKQTPQVGMMVIYDVNSDTLYYDYAVEIYQRLLSEKGTDAWKNQENVAIHIPVSQVLNEENLPGIHERISKMFKASDLMHQAHSASYGVKTVALNNDASEDLWNPETVARDLKRYGQQLLMTGDVGMVDALLDRLSGSKVMEDVDLLMLKVAACSMMGKAVDSNFYLGKCEKFDLSESERSSMQFCGLRNKLNLGKIDGDKFVEECKGMMSSSMEMVPRLVLRLNIMYFTLAGIHLHQRVNDSVLNELADIEREIDLVQDVAMRDQLRLWHLDNVAIVVSHVRDESIERVRVQEAMGILPPVTARAAEATGIFELQVGFVRQLRALRSDGVANNKILLVAQCDVIDLRFHLAFLFVLMGTLQNKEIVDQERKIHVNRLLRACIAVNELSKNRLYRDAYNANISILDYLYILENWYGIELRDMPKESIERSAKAFARELDMGDNLKQMVAPGLIESLRNNTNPTASENSENIRQQRRLSEIAADHIIKSGKYPNAKKEYIVQELEGVKLFTSRCIDGKLEMRVRTQDDNSRFTTPTSFMLVNKSTNLVSAPDTNLDRLLKSWGY